MSQNAPLLRDALNVEERVLGCMCDSFRSSARTKEREKFSSIIDPMPFIVYEIYGFHWGKSNHLNLRILHW